MNQVSNSHQLCAVIPSVTCIDKSDKEYVGFGGSQLIFCGCSVSAALRQEEKGCLCGLLGNCLLERRKGCEQLEMASKGTCWSSDWGPSVGLEQAGLRQGQGTNAETQR